MTQVDAGRKAEGCGKSKNTRTVDDLQDMIDFIDGSTLQADDGDLLANYAIRGSNPALFFLTWPQEELVCS